MKTRRWAWLGWACVALCWTAEAGTGGGVPWASLERVDLDAAAQQLTKAEQIDLPDAGAAAQAAMRAAKLPWVFVQPKAVRLPGGEGLLWQTVHCKKAVCVPEVELRKQAATGSERIEGVSLAGDLGKAERNLRYLPPGLFDVDGDGKPELLIRTQHDRGEGEAALVVDRLEIVRLPDLVSVLVGEELGAKGKGGPTCARELYRIDSNGDGLWDLRLRDGKGCTPSRAGVQALVRPRQQRGYEDFVTVGGQHLVASGLLAPSMNAEAKSFRAQGKTWEKLDLDKPGSLLGEVVDVPEEARAVDALLRQVQAAGRFAGPRAVRLPKGQGVLLQTVRRTQIGSCVATVELRRDGGDGRVLATRALSFAVSPMERTLAFVATGLLDVDGDGKSEVLIRLRSTQKSQQVAGIADEYLVVLNLPDLSVALPEELLNTVNTRRGTALCRREVFRVDVNKDKRMDLRFRDTDGCDVPQPAEFDEALAHGGRLSYRGYKDFVAHPKRRFVAQP